LEDDPIFEVGFHDIELADFNKLFVAPFKNSDRRQVLVERFILLYQKLVEIGVDFEIWIDGSFVTKKKEPDDIDMAVFHIPNQINQLSIHKREMLKHIVMNRNETKLKYYCDVYFIPNVHPVEINYWKKWFENSRAKKARGIARLMIRFDKSDGYLIN